MADILAATIMDAITAEGITAGTMEDMEDITVVATAADIIKERKSPRRSRGGLEKSESVGDDDKSCSGVC